MKYVFALFWICTSFSLFFWRERILRRLTEGNAEVAIAELMTSEAQSILAIVKQNPRQKRKKSNQEKEKSRAFFCATIIVAIKQQRLAFIIFIKFALRTVTLGLRRMFEEFLLKNSEFTHALVTYLYVLTSD